MALVVRGSTAYDVQAMRQEVEVARNILPFEKGPYKNAISLPSAEQVYAPYQTHRNSVPFSGALDHCPYLKSIFDSFQTEKAAFRLLRRLPKTAYAFHDDKDRGKDIARFQIPINSSTDAFLLIATQDLDLIKFDTDGSGFKGDSNGDLWFNMQQLHAACADRVELFYLDAGVMNYFDTDQVHTLINAASAERITLSLDLVVNAWLENWIETNLQESVPPAAIEPSTSVTWKWNALRNGIIRTD